MWKILWSDRITSCSWETKEEPVTDGHFMTFEDAKDGKKIIISGSIRAIEVEKPKEEV